MPTDRVTDRVLSLWEYAIPVSKQEAIAISNAVNNPKAPPPVVLKNNPPQPMFSAKVVRVSFWLGFILAFFLVGIFSLLK